MAVAAEMSGQASLDSGSRPKPKTRTFRRSVLEADFLRFCQLSTETPDAHLTAEQRRQLTEEAQCFVPSEEFSARSAERVVLGDEFLTECAPEKARLSRKKVDMPAHLAGLCETPLLTREQEKQLFRRMNYMRYRAHKILEAGGDTAIDQWDLERIRGLLRAACWYRDVVVRSNVRLVISIVKNFANPQCSFDDLLSDGIMALIRSVDKFDYQLGFRFSTYATQVVRRNSYRFVMERQEERFKVTNSISEIGLDVAEDDSHSTMSEGRWHALRNHLDHLLGLLDKRERLIIRARFSLGGHHHVKTLQRLADKLGISKERVRQLEKRAVQKLQDLANQTPLDFLEATR